MIIIQWKRLFYAGVAGYSSKKIYSWLNRHPEVWNPLATGAACSGVTGSVIGMGAAWYRNQPLVRHSLSVGVTFAIATGSFIGLHYFVNEQLDNNSLKDNYSKVSINYVVSGGCGLTVGTLFALLSKSKFMSVFFISTSGLLAGVIGQFSYNQFELWRRQKAIELYYPDLLETHKRQKLPWNYERFEKVWLNFWHRQSRTGLIESDIVLLEDCIKEEKRKIEALDLELAKMSIPISDNIEQYTTKTKTNEKITGNIVQRE